MNCEELVSSYLKTLKSAFSCTPASDGRLRVITPYLYPDHDLIELFVREAGKEVVVSDLGETLRHLETIGVDAVTAQKRVFQVQHITRGIGVFVQQGVIFK